MTQRDRNLLNYLESMRKARQAYGDLPEGFSYFGMEDYLLQHGRWYEMVPLPDRIPRGIERYCFDNSRKLASDRRRNLRYIEGVAIRRDFYPLPVHHAWNATSKGVGIDSTWVPLGDPYFGVEFDITYVNEMGTDGYSVLDNWPSGHALYKVPAKGK